MKVAWQNLGLRKVALVSGLSFQRSHVRDCQLISRRGRCKQCIQVAAAEMTDPTVVFCACATSEQVASSAWKMKDFILPASSELASDRTVFGSASSSAPPFKNAVPFFLLGDHPVYQQSSRLRLARTLILLINKPIHIAILHTKRLFSIDERQGIQTADWIIRGT